MLSFLRRRAVEVGEQPRRDADFAAEQAGEVAVVGETETLAGGTVIVAEFDLVVSVAEVAVIVTVSALAGGLAGAE